MPAPMSTLGGELFAPVAAGWRTGTDRYGLPPDTGTFGESNRWFFFGAADPGEVDLDELESAAADALARRRWVADLEHWSVELRPRVMAESRALVAVDLGSLDDEELAAHLQAAIGHFGRSAPEHFAQMPVYELALGELYEACQGWGVSRRRLVPILVGG
jgi:hypothetical protein